MPSLVLPISGSNPIIYIYALAKTLDSFIIPSFLSLTPHCQSICSAFRTHSIPHIIVSTATTLVQGTTLSHRNDWHVLKLINLIPLFPLLFLSPHRSPSDFSKCKFQPKCPLTDEWIKMDIYIYIIYIYNIYIT